MKDFIVPIAATLPLIAFELIVAVVYTFLVESIL